MIMIIIIIIIIMISRGQHRQRHAREQQRRDAADAPRGLQLPSLLGCITVVVYY